MIRRGQGQFKVKDYNEVILVRTKAEQNAVILRFIFMIKTPAEEQELFKIGNFGGEK